VPLKLGILAFLIAMLAGCGSHTSTHSTRAVESAFQAEHVRLSRVRTNPNVLLISRERRDGAAAFAVFIFSDIGRAEDAQQRQAASLRSSSQQWMLLTGRKVDLSSQVRRTDNVVVLLSSGVSQPLRDKVSRALSRLGSAA
jgi:hypothetical protein